MDENPACASPNVVGIHGCHPLLEGFVWGTPAATTLFPACRSSVLLPALLCLSVLQLYLRIGLSFGVCCCRCRSVLWRMLCRCCCLGGCLATSSLRSPRSFSCRACDGPHYGCFAVMVLFRRMLGRRGRLSCRCFAAVVEPAPLASLVDADYRGYTTP